ALFGANRTCSRWLNSNVSAAWAAGSGSNIRLPQPLAKVLPPALRKRRQLAHAAQKVLVRRVRRVQGDDVGHRHAVPVPGDQLERVAGRDLPLLKDRKIETGYFSDLGFTSNSERVRKKQA